MRVPPGLFFLCKQLVDRFGSEGGRFELSLLVAKIRHGGIGFVDDLGPEREEFKPMDEGGSRKRVIASIPRIDPKVMNVQ